jgi:hypothetical protein
VGSIPTASTIATNSNRPPGPGGVPGPAGRFGLVVRSADLRRDRHQPYRTQDSPKQGGTRLSLAPAIPRASPQPSPRQPPALPQERRCLAIGDELDEVDDPTFFVSERRCLKFDRFRNMGVKPSDLGLDVFKHLLYRCWSRTLRTLQAMVRREDVFRRRSVRALSGRNSPGSTAPGRTHSGGS